MYPTAIGSEPQDSSVNSYPHWIRTMVGHAAANMVGQSPNEPDKHKYARPVSEGQYGTGMYVLG